MKDTRQRLSSGTIIKRQDTSGETYIIDSTYGAGGSAIVYRAKELINGKEKRDVLIKELFPANGFIRDNDGTIKAEHPEFEYRLDEYEDMMCVESTIGRDIIGDDPWASSIEAPFVSSEGNRYSVIGIAPPGITLKDLLKDKSHSTITLRAFLVLFYKLAEAVRRIHEKGYLHLDISPSNIRIIDREDVKGTINQVAAYEDPTYAGQYAVMIIDFGCSRKMDADGTTVKYIPSPTTDGYSAPELYSDNEEYVDCRADIFSICACFKRCIRDLPTLTGFSAKVKEKLDELIEVGMNDDPEYRWLDADELLKQIGELLKLINGSNVNTKYLERLLEDGNLSANSYYRDSIKGITQIEDRLDRLVDTVSQILSNMTPSESDSQSDSEELYDDGIEEYQPEYADYGYETDDIYADTDYQNGKGKSLRRMIKRFSDRKILAAAGVIVVLSVLLAILMSQALKSSNSGPISEPVTISGSSTAIAIPSASDAISAETESLRNLPADIKYEYIGITEHPDDNYAGISYTKLLRLTAVAEDGSILWEYGSPPCLYFEVPVDYLQYLGTFGDLVLINEQKIYDQDKPEAEYDGRLRALNVYTGQVMWDNYDFHGDTLIYAYDEDKGIIYLSSESGYPHLCAVDTAGNIIWCCESVSPLLSGAEEIRLEKDHIIVKFGWCNDKRYEMSDDSAELAFTYDGEPIYPPSVNMTLPSRIEESYSKAESNAEGIVGHILHLTAYDSTDTVLWRYDSSVCYFEGTAGRGSLAYLGMYGDLVLVNEQGFIRSDGVIGEYSCGRLLSLDAYSGQEAYENYLKSAITDVKYSEKRHAIYMCSRYSGPDLFAIDSRNGSYLWSCEDASPLLNEPREIKLEENSIAVTYYECDESMLKDPDDTTYTLHFTYDGKP